MTRAAKPARPRWLRKGAFILLPSGEHMRVTAVAPPPLTIFLARTTKRTVDWPHVQSRCFLQKDRATKWYPSDASARRILGDPDVVGPDKLRTMTGEENSVLYKRLLDSLWPEKRTRAPSKRPAKKGRRL